jgi:hypothetical protein
MYASLYGLDIGYDDPLSRKGKEALDIFAQIFSNGFPTLERFPWLRFMPSFFPGCGFKQTVLELRQNFSALDTIPFDRAVNNLVSEIISNMARIYHPSRNLALAHLLLLN